MTRRIVDGELITDTVTLRGGPLDGKRHSAAVGAENLRFYADGVVLHYTNIGGDGFVYQGESDAFPGRRS